MALAPGTRLGPYELVGALGAGGMGEVYRARDTRLDRSVAIKVLPTDVAGDPARRARFEREAKAVAALDHAHICGIYDVGQADGTHFLVMPLLDGQTLAARLERGSLPQDQALKVASEVADALDKAHRAGLVHRDVKPANIMLTKAGAKLLDFGLAKLQAPAAPISLSGMAQLTPATTETAEGTILGTVPYMAPEQVEGKEADARSDIWALGAVAYEMLTGERPFRGDTAASVIGAILKDAPALTLAPPLLDRTVRRCLEKDPGDRWQSAADMRHTLLWIGEGVAHGSRPRPPRLSGVLLLGVTAASLLAVAAMAPGWLSRSREMPAEVSRLSIVPPPNARFSPPPASVVAVQTVMSPDGRRVAFVAEQGGGRPGLWVRPVDSLEARLLSGTEDAIYPFWSPDSRSLGFFSRGKLKVIELAGGPPRTLSDAPPDPRGASWNRDGVILFAPALPGIFRISVDGGPPTRVTELDVSRAENSHRFPSFLPDGHHFIYTVRSERAENWGISIASLDNPKGTVLTVGTDWRAEVVPPGYLLFMRGSSLMAQAMDLGTHRLVGEPVTVAEPVGTATTGYASFSASHTGDLVYAPPPGLDGELRWFTRTGIALSRVTESGAYLDFALAPDENRLAASRVDPQPNTADVWTRDLRGPDQWSRLTNDRLNDSGVLWSPDGSRIAFRSNRNGVNEIFWKRPGGAAAEERWFGLEQANLIGTDWSLDGHYIVITNASSPGGSTILVWDTSGSGEPKVAVKRPINAMHGRLSPDGQWLAYASDEDGDWQVYVQRFPVTSADDQKQLSFNGGVEPRWRGDGQELFFLGTDMRIMSVEIPGGNALAAATAQPLFQARVPLMATQRTNYVVSRDGQRFLINTAVGDGLSSPLSIVLNWPALLTR